MILQKQLALCLEKGRSVRAMCFVATSRLERRHVCGSLTTKFHLRCVAYARSISQSERVSHSKLLLTAQMEQKASDFQRIIAGDESWFFLYYPSGWRRVMTFLNA
jgi:hypothetical protein